MCEMHVDFTLQLCLHLHTPLPPLPPSPGTQFVWPSLVLVGGLDGGLGLGREVQLEGAPAATLTSTPDSDHNVVIQDLVTSSTNTVKKRLVGEGREGEWRGREGV